MRRTGSSQSVLQPVQLSWNHLVTFFFDYWQLLQHSHVRIYGNIGTYSPKYYYFSFFAAHASDSRPLSALCRPAPPASVINQNSRSPLRNVGVAVEHEATLPGGGGDIHQTHAVMRRDVCSHRASVTKK